MVSNFLEILCCPKTGADLILDAYEIDRNGLIKSGMLKSVEGKGVYPIINGIPRFVGEEFYASSFGYEWKKWSRVQFESENVGKRMEGHTDNMFKKITGFDEKNVKGRLVIEFGCGPGRFLDRVRDLGGIAVGIDMSEAVESARENFRDDPNVLIVQGDILNPPFKTAAFDGGYTIGVLHHTPAPVKGFKKMVDLIKKDGLVACCVYPKGGFYDFPSVGAYRKIHNLVKHIFGNKPSLSYAYFSAYFLYYVFSVVRKVPVGGAILAHYLEKYIFVNLDLRDAKWRVLDVFDAITPTYASTHTSEEVRKWFVEAGCYDIRQTSWCPTSFVGRKGN